MRDRDDQRRAPDLVDDLGKERGHVSMSGTRGGDKLIAAADLCGSFTRDPSRQLRLEDGLRERAREGDAEHLTRSSEGV